MNCLLNKKHIFVIACLFMPGILFAQLPVVRTSLQTSRILSGTGRSFEEALRRGGLLYVGSSQIIGRESLLPKGTSVVGSSAQQKYLKIRQNTQFLGNKISRLIAHQFITKSAPDFFPGFNINFPDAWERFALKTHTSKGSIGVVLEAAFGSGEIAEGTFVRSFEEIRQMASTPVKHPVTCEQAVKDAFAQSQEIQNGFFVVRLLGNENRPKDIFILDITLPTEKRAFRWISFNRSKALEYRARVKQKPAPKK